ncbi:MAG: TonB-dependent receptor, partial [Acidobacteriota bacterium]
MRSFRNSFARVALLALLLVLAPVSAQAQQVLGTIQGLVTDTDGGVLPGVTVTVLNSETGVDRVVVTDAAGFYRARPLQSGVYEVTAQLDGFATSRIDNVRLLLAQSVDIDLTLQVEGVEEIINVTAETPLVETSRSSAADYITEAEIEALPIQGRDFTDFALLTPTVQRDPDRGFITIAGQRGIYSGLNIDGTSAKSAFFGYGRGGEATENDGLVVAQDSVKEFQVVTSAFAPEYGANGGGYVNVITKSGTNTLRGSGFAFFTDDSLSEDLPSSPLDDFNNRDGSRDADEFERLNYGLSVGGPIVEDKTHFFISWDQTDRDEPFTRSIDTPGVYDAIITRGQSEPGFTDLVAGFDRESDGTATGLFTSSVDNLILFGKIDHEFTDKVSASLRANFTDYEQTSDFLDEESLKTEDTLSLVGSLLNLVGDSGVNEFRFQYAFDNLDRLSQRVGDPIEAQIRFRFGDFDSVGKFDFLPIFVEEEKLQVQNAFSYLSGNHDLKFGFDYQEDQLAQLFAGSLDGRYDFNSIEDFLNNNAARARINFGDVTFPNYDETQELLAIYAQDAWRVNDDLTVNYGLRYNATYNPDDLAHLFPEGRDIPDDDDNWAPRVGFAFTPGGSGRDVVRGGIGLFYGRTPSLLFASQVQSNGLFPNFGRITVSPGQTGFVPLGTPIDNENPPETAVSSPAYV